jgi:hypothetical protein
MGNTGAIHTAAQRKAMSAAVTRNLITGTTVRASKKGAQVKMCIDVLFNLASSFHPFLHSAIGGFQAGGSAYSTSITIPFLSAECHLKTGNQKNGTSTETIHSNNRFYMAC